MNLFRFSLFFVIILSGCEKVVDLDINSGAKKIVVEGYIQQGYPAYVFLTKSEGYFDLINEDSFENLAIDDALVFIEREDGVIHKLTYIDQDLIDSLNLPDSLSLPFNALYLDLSYKNNEFSQIGYNYKLIVEWNGDTILANTSIPPEYPIDSIWVQKKDSLESDYKHYIWARVNDPDTLGNSVLVHFKRDVGWRPMSPFFIPCAIPVRSDNLVNGESFDAFFARSGRFNEEDGALLPFYSDRVIDGELVRKDIVLLRISHINYTTYQFWRSATRMEDAGNNPFAEPMNLSSNIEGGLGIFGGYGVSYYYIPIVSDTVIYDTYNDVDVFEIF